VEYHPWLFLAAVASHYVVLMSGIVSFGFALWRRAKRRPVTDAFFWIIAIVVWVLRYLGRGMSSLIARNNFRRNLIKHSQTHHLRRCNHFRNRIPSFRLRSRNWKPVAGQGLALEIKDDIEKLLKQIPAPKNPVFVTFSDQSGIGLADDLASIFKNVNWRQLPAGVSFDAMGATGLTIQAKPDDQAAVCLKDGLNRIGLKPTLDTNNFDKRNYTLDNHRDSHNSMTGRQLPQSRVFDFMRRFLVLRFASDTGLAEK
jgi:hypothetical protein